MKKVLFAVIAILFAACKTDTTKDIAIEAPEILTASFEEDTRIQLMNGKTVWNTGDLVSVFYKSDANDCYKFTGTTGDRTSTLQRVTKGEESRRGDNVVVVYPYNKNYLISLSAGTIEAYLPAEQTYINNSFGIGSSPMVGVSDYKQFVLKNVCGWLKVQFTGNGEVVDRITLRGNNSEQVAGDIMIVAEDASAILASAGVGLDDDLQVGGSLLDEDSIITEVSLVCPDGVTLGEEPTAFYIALPPQTFSKGFTAELICKYNDPIKKSTDKCIAISRNTIQPMGSTGVVTESIPTNQIRYTSSDGNIVIPYKTDIFGANIVSNTYKNGQGIITFDAPVTEIGDKAFGHCNSLTSVTIPDSVTTIGSYAFYYCSSLTSVTIPNSVTTIGNYAFEGCSSLASITIPNSVTSIGEYAFYRCSSLASVTIGNSVTSIGYSAFASCSSLASISIPDSVTSIGDSAFDSCRSLASISIPDSVTSIGDYAFDSCSSLASITIPNSVTSIGYSAFQYCSSLTSITIPDSVTTLGNNPFERCSNLAEFNGKFASVDKRCLVVDGVLNSFAPAGLTEYTIPDSVTSIGSDAFSYCSSLASVTIPNSVTSIGKYAFYKCSSLASVTIPDSVTSIDYSAFYSCSSLKDVYINAIYPPSLESNVFMNTALENIYVYSECIDIYKTKWSDYADRIASNNSSAGESVFTYTTTDGNTIDESKIEFVVKSNTYTDGVGKLVVYGENIKAIPNKAFYKCTTLKTITIPDSVTSIGSDAFYKCSSLASVTIPESVTSIVRCAFEDCRSLKSVYCKPTTPPVADFKGYSSWNAFNSNASGRKIYVPRASESAYEAASYWGNYAADIEPYDF